MVLDCPDAVALAQFYADVLGWQVEEGSSHPQQVHLDPAGHPFCLLKG